MSLMATLRELFAKLRSQKSAPAQPMTPAASVAVADTPPLAAVVATPTLPTGACASGVLNVGWMTDVGRVRGHNEDGIFVFSAEQLSSSAVPHFAVFILADGMGGHLAGEVASAMACKVVAGQLLGKVYLPMLDGFERGSTQPALNELMSEAIVTANRIVSQALPSSGTTLTCALVMGGRLLIGHVGDSRAYLQRVDAELQILTQDHTYVNKLIEIGQLTPEEAAVHPQRNVLYRAVGQGASLDVDVVTKQLRMGDQILLCSDGLWGLVSHDEMWRIVTTAASPREACAQLVRAANEAGGNDNISVIIAKVEQDLV